jgi:two-component system response regulator MprA
MADLLIVDDDQDTAEMLADILAGEGHAIRLAHDGLQALERLKSGSVDLILLDVEMPRLSGPGMAYHLFLRDLGLENIPIVLLSAKLDLPRVAAAVGTPYFLTKPYAVDTLLALMARALSERTPPRPRLEQLGDRP